jgi:STE24 endopeptidase
MITLKSAILVILIAGFLLETLLDMVNLRHRKAGIPDEMQGYLDSDKYQKSQEYHRVVTRFGLITGTISLLSTVALIQFGGFGWLDEQLRSITDEPILLALLFFGVLYLVSDVLTLPFQYYRTFVIEEKFGFNQTTFKTFITDKIKGYLLASLIGLPILALFIFLLESMGKDFWWVFWIVIGLFSVVMNLMYTSVILPLFNKLTPLEEGELLDAIRAYCEKVQFPIRKVYVIDGSKRSKKSNAFFSGFGKQKKVVLYDTLIENHNTDELVAILAHEVGHYKKKHIIWGLGTGLIQTGAILFILSRFVFSEDLSMALGGNVQALHLNLLAFFLLFSPVSKILGVLANIISRKHEFEADEYAAKTYAAAPMMEALKKLSVDNLSNLYPHPAYVFVHYSHPPLLKRISAIRLSATS